MSNLQRIFKKAEEDYKKKPAYATPTGAASVFFVNKNQFKLIASYTSCRGFIYDHLRTMFGKYVKGKPYGVKNRYFYIYYNGTKGTIGIHKITTKTITLMSEVLNRLEYAPLQYIAKDNKFLIKLNVRVLKNLYATSLLFLLLKLPQNVQKKKVVDFDTFLKYAVLSLTAKNIAVINNWQKIFPKDVPWRIIYSYGNDFSSLHNEGISELLGARTKFVDINKAVRKVLKGTK